MTPFGFVMNASDGIVSGQFEPEVVSLLESLLRRSDRFVNVGANSGFYCLLARKLGVPVVAFEPVAQTAATLMQNLRANKYDEGTVVLPVAAGALPSVSQIYGVGTGASLLRGWANNPESLTQLVSVVRLDDILRQTASDEKLLLLVDVEGYEFEALSGATAVLSIQPKPVLVVEIVPDGAGKAASQNIQQTFELMSRSGYVAHGVTDGLPETDTPIKGVTNYLFHDKSLTLADIGLGDH